LPTEKDVAVAQDFLRSAFAGKASEAVDLLDPEVTYQVPGSHHLAGIFHGRDEVATHVGDLMRITSHRIDVLQFEDWMVGLNNLSALIRLRVQRDRLLETFRAIYLFAISESGKIKHIQIFFADQAAADRLFR
jgi:hypothetical protein